MNIKLIVDELYPIRKILNIKENFNGNVKCPSGLHGDKHPSSHIYENHLHCFTCRKNYYVSQIADFKGISMDSLYQELLLKYSEKELKEYFNHFMKDKESKQEKKEIKKERNEDFISFTMRFFSK